ncbi:MAG: S9 family peptidase, partial [Cyclobacteriaceae bacterium]|nr:S9 family peptidase [Cyclobacteriaceae bacterium]
MKKYYFIILLTAGIIGSAFGQGKMTPEKLWELKRVSGVGITKDQKNVIYYASQYDIQSNSRTGKYYSIPIGGGKAVEINNYADLITDKNLSPDGKLKLEALEVKLKNISGKDFYEDMSVSDVLIFDNLNYRHWDTWEDGSFSHVFIRPTAGSNSDIDLMEGEPFDCPQMPFGGDEDYIWGPDGKTVLYVTKKSYGAAYAVSTNSDIYEYNLETKKTVNLTENNKGYDTQPAFSPKGVLAWTQMKRDGYESDKNDIIVRLAGTDINLTKDWDGTVNGFLWGEKGEKIYFNAPVGGTVQLFEISLPKDNKTKPTQPRQITDGQFDINGLVGQVKNTFVVSRTDMNHSAELYTVDLKKGELKQLTHVNDEDYAKISMSKVEKRIIKTTDNKDMVTWVIYPPDFDPAKKYPTLLYCQGGPQGALSQFYSVRWNFQLMAANGYIIVAPNRRGMPGYGVEWNEQISKDYGGQNMKDYLSAIDEVAKEPFVDNDRLGCVGASYGGYSVFYLAGMHNRRFKTFISHDGIFNWRSMYGTTEEMFFVNWDLGGAYWDKENAAAQKSYNQFNPINYVQNWDTPILIIQGGRDYRVPIGQGLEAFQAAQLRGIKSKLLYFPNENHWILSAQNGIIWQRE